ncbi:MAG: nicotinate-nicotinamide nucleotide adenylyltransferase [Alphaproteobacteria bacterium]|nr:nicotinate-nicotinamide nucleotide adenylyltransferase [Alphaproteobacteria bacterium]
MRVGLLGGSFNPPHEGHLHISLIAMAMLKLDCVWWVVTPQNPLKSPQGVLPFEERFSLCEDIARHPRIIVTAIEQQLKYNRTLYTVRALKRHFPKTEFVFVTGMDTAQMMHRWLRWKELLAEIATVHMGRPPAHSVIRATPMRMIGSQRHVYPRVAARYSLQPRTSYWVLQKKMIDISSTVLRRTNSRFSNEFEGLRSCTTEARFPCAAP